MNADDLILTLDLAPHPEGGHYRQTWIDDASTAIYFLLREGEQSAWHRLRGRTEIWHFYGGDPLRLLIDPDGPGTASARAVEVGMDLLTGQRPQAVVPAGAWQSARSLGSWSLVGCTVAPPFTFDVLEFADRW